MGRLKVKKVSSKPVLTVRRLVRNGSGKKQSFSKLVYIAVANKPISYAFKKSPIVYIGTTKRGLRRILESALMSEEILGLHGVTKLDFHVVICSARQRLKSWEMLERALVMRFRDTYGAIPLNNDKFRKAADRKWEQSFAVSNLDAILSAVSERARKK